MPTRLSPGRRCALAPTRNRMKSDARRLCRIRAARSNIQTSVTRRQSVAHGSLCLITGRLAAICQPARRRPDRLRAGRGGEDTHPYRLLNDRDGRMLPPICAADSNSAASDQTNRRQTCRRRVEPPARGRRETINSRTERTSLVPFPASPATDGIRRWPQDPVAPSSAQSPKFGQCHARSCRCRT